MWLKFVRKQSFKKTAEATGNLITNKIADKIKTFPKILSLKNFSKNNSETNEEKILKEKYISPELR